MRRCWWNSLLIVFAVNKHQCTAVPGGSVAASQFQNDTKKVQLQSKGIAAERQDVRSLLPGYLIQ